MANEAKLDAQYYQAHSDIQKALATKILAYHTFANDEHVLDVGCGDGALTAEIAKHIPAGRVLGIDPSSEMITFAKQKYLANHPNLAFRVAAAEDEHGNARYSLITSFNCLYWVKEIEKAMSSLYAALKPGGAFLALIYPRGSIFWQPFIETLQQPAWQAYMKDSICPYWKTSDEWQQLAKQIGFETIQVDVIDDTVCFKTQEEYMTYVRAYLPCLLQASEKVLTNYLKDVAAFTKKHFLSKNELVIPYTKLHMYLCKPLSSPLS